LRQSRKEREIAARLAEGIAAPLDIHNRAVARRETQRPETPAAAGPLGLEPVRLRFASDAKPGIRRIRARGGFRYVDADGTPINDEAVLDRIRRLAVPPAWEDVWICPRADGHIQATGRDARGRKQYRYHPQWRAERDEEKYGRMVEFGRALPRIRRRVERDLRRPGLDRERVLATLVRLLETTFMRIGNEQYARENRSYGLTTLRNRHVAVEGTRIRFRFRGKSGLQHEVGLRDRRLARIVRKIQELPGQELFQYLDGDGEPRAIESADVNEYLREASGADVTAKDFRTWAGTLLAFRALRGSGTAEVGASPASATRRVVRESTELVAKALGNTPAVSRSSYIAPPVVDAYLAGDLPRALVKAGETTDQLQPDADRDEELALIKVLEAARVAGAGMRAKRGSAA
jgi:DNA topoisomerase-1